MLNIIAKNVKSNLTRKVHGEVYCHALYGNTIVCDIICKEIIYHHIEKYIKEEISSGLSSAIIADKILCSYARYIKCYFFK